MRTDMVNDYAIGRRRDTYQVYVYTSDRYPASFRLPLVEHDHIWCGLGPAAPEGIQREAAGVNEDLGQRATAKLPDY
jgi:hypothetical protein